MCGNPGGEVSPPAPLPTLAAGRQIDVADYQPRSMLRVSETRIERSRFPVIDFHTHLSWSKDETNTYLASPEALLEAMDRRNIRTLVNLTGGCGRGLQEAVEKFDHRYAGRFATFKPEAAGGPRGAGQTRRCARPEGAQDAGSVSPRQWRGTRQGGRPDRFNERFEELRNHPDWSFYGNAFPGNGELLEALDRVIGRHRRTTFVAGPPVL
jgi:hypothetical protein